jgi:hypothetical protein
MVHPPLRLEQQHYSSTSHGVTPAVLQVWTTRRPVLLVTGEMGCSLHRHLLHLDRPLEKSKRYPYGLAL